MVYRGGEQKKQSVEGSVFLINICHKTIWNLINYFITRILPTAPLCLALSLLISRAGVVVWRLGRVGIVRASPMSILSSSTGIDSRGLPLLNHLPLHENKQTNKQTNEYIYTSHRKGKQHKEIIIYYVRAKT